MVNGHYDTQKAVKSKNKDAFRMTPLYFPDLQLISRVCDIANSRSEEYEEADKHNSLICSV